MINFDRSTKSILWMAPPLPPVAKCSFMARELVWLENSTFAAWGCSACNWILANPGTTLPGNPSTEVKDAFNKHDCTAFPRHGRK
jgi:hypothetical protein